MSKKIKFAFEREDGVLLETNAINIVDEVIDGLTSYSGTAALSAYQGRVLNEKIGDLGGKLPQLLWTGNLRVNFGGSDYIDAASINPDLFQDPGLFALKLEVEPYSTGQDVMPLIITVLIDTEEGGGYGSTNFSCVAMGYSEFLDGDSGRLAWGNITFFNSSGQVEFHNGYFYDFAEIEENYAVTLHDLEYINILSVHRISRTAID